MKVCLVFPCLRNFGGFNSLGRSPDSIYVNHGLASISAVLKKHDHAVKMVDLRECSDWTDVENKLRLADADYYGVYMQTLDFHEANRCNEILHRLGKKTIVGGPHPSICPQHVLDKTQFDHVFVGEAEETFPVFLENPENYDRLIVGEHPDLNELPYEDREIFNMQKVLKTRHGFFPSPFLSVIVGRGCPFRCSFCKPGEDKIFGKFRMRNLDHLMGEIEMLAKKYNYGVLMIDDDSFTIKADYVAEFCERYTRIDRPFVTQTRADFIVRHPELVKELKKAGLWMFLIGFESGNQRILDLYCKDATVKTNLEAARICHENGIKIWANFILGAPTETKDEVMDTLEMLRKIKPTHYSPSFYTPIIGTHLYDYCKNEGLLLTDDPADMGSRSPLAPKIRGQDYQWLRKTLNHSLHKDWRYQARRVIGQVRRCLP